MVKKSGPFKNAWGPQKSKGWLVGFRRIGFSKLVGCFTKIDGIPTRIFWSFLLEESCSPEAVNQDDFLNKTPHHAFPHVLSSYTSCRQKRQQKIQNTPTENWRLAFEPTISNLFKSPQESGPHLVTFGLGSEAKSWSWGFRLEWHAKEERKFHQERIFEKDQISYSLHWSWNVVMKMIFILGPPRHATCIFLFRRGSIMCVEGVGSLRPCIYQSSMRVLVT